MALFQFYIYSGIVILYLLITIKFIYKYNFIKKAQVVNLKNKKPINYKLRNYAYFNPILDRRSKKIKNS